MCTYTQRSPTFSRVRIKRLLSGSPAYRRNDISTRLTGSDSTLKTNVGQEYSKIGTIPILYRRVIKFYLRSRSYDDFIFFFISMLGVEFTARFSAWNVTTLSFNWQTDLINFATDTSQIAHYRAQMFWIPKHEETELQLNQNWTVKLIFDSIPDVV